MKTILQLTVEVDGLDPRLEDPWVVWESIFAADPTLWDGKPSIIDDGATSFRVRFIEGEWL